MRAAVASWSVTRGGALPTELVALLGSDLIYAPRVAGLSHPLLLTLWSTVPWSERRSAWAGRVKKK